MKTAYRAQYCFPGAFMPEAATREIKSTEWGDIIAAVDGDGWYAVTIYRDDSKTFTAEDGEVREIVTTQKVKSYVVGTLIHISNIPDVDPETGQSFEILKGNVHYNSEGALKDYAVKTRAGNWQIASNYDEVRQA